jgi:hypothetical protein
VLGIDDDTVKVEDNRLYHDDTPYCRSISISCSFQLL